MLVRKITETDIPGFHAVLDSVARESNFLRSDGAPPIEAVAAFVRQNIENQNPQFVAIDDQGQVIGWCDIVRARGRHESHVGELGMGVAAHFRGRGIGRQLLPRPKRGGLRTGGFSAPACEMQTLLAHREGSTPRWMAADM